MEPPTPINDPKEASIKDADTKGMQPLPKLAQMRSAEDLPYTAAIGGKAEGAGKTGKE